LIDGSGVAMTFFTRLRAAFGMECARGSSTFGANTGAGAKIAPGSCSFALRKATLGTHPFLDIVISYFGTTVPSPDRVHEHSAARATTT
jgi:hypothetical protein